jgi:hypothetical protein
MSGRSSSGNDSPGRAARPRLLAERETWTSMFVTSPRESTSSRANPIRASTLESTAVPSRLSPIWSEVNPTMFGKRRPRVEPSAAVVGWVEPRLVAARPTGNAVPIGGPHDAKHRSTHPTVPQQRRYPKTSWLSCARKVSMTRIRSPAIARAVAVWRPSGMRRSLR